MMEDLRFHNCFVFKYSPRTGTKAAELEDNVPDEVKKVRNARLLALQKTISLEENRKLIGKTVQALVEGASKSVAHRLSGRSRQSHIVVFTGQQEMVGQLVDVMIQEATDLTLYGTIAPAP